MTTHAPLAEQPQDPTVADALTRRCDQCHAKPGQLCVKRGGIHHDLKGRLIHIGRKEKP